jgi:hypothetical protein
MSKNPQKKLWHTCNNCGNDFSGNFCNLCGEKVYHEHDRSFSHLIEEVFHFVTHFEGTFILSLKTMLSKPGKISDDFCNGVRKKYFKPLSFFLMLVILYLLFPLFEGLNMRPHFYENNNLFGSYATAQLERVKTTKHLTDEELEETFLHKGEKVSKFLLFIVIPFMALLSLGAGFKKRKYYFDHFIFSTEVVSFFILWGFLILPAIVWLAAAIGVQLFHSEDSLGIVLFSGLGIYAGIASTRFFRFPRLISLLYAVGFALSLTLFLQYVYKFILFWITIHLV